MSKKKSFESWKEDVRKSGVKAGHDGDVMSKLNLDAFKDHHKDGVSPDKLIKENFGIAEGRKSRRDSQN